MFTTFAQKFSIPLAFLMSVTSTPAAKIKSMAAEAKRIPSYQVSIEASAPQFAVGDISKKLKMSTGTITAIGSDGVNLLVGSDQGSLNLLHASGWTEDLTGMLSVGDQTTARINTIDWNAKNGYWMVGGSMTSKDASEPSKPLLVKLIPNGLQTDNLELEARKWKLREITDIACKGAMCLITGAPGKVLTYDGATLTDRSAQFGFIADSAPRVATNGLVWIVAGTIRDAVDNQMITALYLYDGTNVRLLSDTDHSFLMRALPAVDITANADGSAWLAMAHDGMLHAWILDGAEFAPAKGFPKDTYLMPTLGSTDTGWMVGGGDLQKNIFSLNKSGVMTPGNYPDTNVSSILSTPFGTFIGGLTGAASTLIRIK